MARKEESANEGKGSAFGRNMVGGGQQAKPSYRTVRGDLPVYLHPSSFLTSITSRDKLPSFVVFMELLVTTKQYIHNVTTIDGSWLTELCPNFFKTAPATEIGASSKHALR